MKQTAFQLSLLLPTLFQLLPTSLAYKWPDPQIDEADHYLYDQFGYKGNDIFGVGVPTCSEFFGAPNVGRQTAAEWLRTAFHDVATHDAATGTGGLDGSIAVEAGRPENAGRAVNITVNFLLDFVTPNTGLADLLALGARVALDVCQGPVVPFRVGRIDNLNPGPSGVPEPDQDLQTHISAFSRMGFTQQEMIGLVACGHSIGGVHHQSFPTIVPPPDDPFLNNEGVQHFDSTFDSYDNKVATEFVAGIPNNPLAYGANIATNSDFRIFASDGNATISSFADSQDLFFSTCANLFERMLNTVPSGVTLTEVINPIAVKPRIYLDIQDDGSLNVFGEVRFFDMQDNSNRVVKFIWLDRNGQCSQGTCSVTVSHDDSHVTTTVRNKQSLWYSFSATLDSTTSISQFWFEVDENDGSGPKQVKSENGSAFPLEDRVFLLPSKSCDRSNGEDGTSTAVVNFAVRSGSGSQNVNPQINQEIITLDKPDQIYLRSSFTASPTLAANSTSPNYQIYTATFGGKPFVLSTYTIDIVAQLNGQEVKDIAWADTELALSPFNCPPLDG